MLGVGKRVRIFLRDIYPKVKIITQIEFELFYSNIEADKVATSLRRQVVTQFIINVTTSILTALQKWHFWSDIFIWPRKRLFFDKSFSIRRLLSDQFGNTYPQKSSWLTFYCQSHSLAPGSLIFGSGCCITIFPFSASVRSSSILFFAVKCSVGVRILYTSKTFFYIEDRLHTFVGSCRDHWWKIDDAVLG